MSNTTFRTHVGMGIDEGHPLNLTHDHHGNPRSGGWSTVRKHHLEKEPTCRACGADQHLTVHHIRPFSWPGGHGHELDPNNLVTLCESPSHNCHLWLGHFGDFHSANPDVLAMADDFRKKLENRPYPPAAKRAA